MLRQFLIVWSVCFSLSQIHNESALAHSPVTEDPSWDELRWIDQGDGNPQWMSLRQAMKFSEKSHENGRCGGFFDRTDELKNGQTISTTALPLVNWFTSTLGNRPLTQKSEIGRALPLVSASRIQQTVESLSKYRNRFYTSSTGVEAAKWIADQYRSLAGNRSDIQIDLFTHTWQQPSVIVTWKGGNRSNVSSEIVVIGGHEDSIVQSGFGSPQMNAPGADDNASGMATILEVFRVLLETGFQPDRTLQFMAYAAEEVGLRGSQAIANVYKQQSQSVVAVIQFDMTAFPGSGKKIVFMTDFVNPELTQFTQKLADTYVKFPWSTDKCGYACSDHASWHRVGYPAVMPFESMFRDSNSDIHTGRDLAGQLDWDHSHKFAQLGLSFVVELSKEAAPAVSFLTAK